jgi:hypothetical protein
MQEQHVNEEFDAARPRYLARHEAGGSATCRMRKRAAVWVCHSGELSGQLGRFKLWTRRRASSARIPWVSLGSGTLLASSPVSRGRRSRSLTGRRICRACGPRGTASSTPSMKNGVQSRSTTSPACRGPGISSLSATTFCSWHLVIVMVKRGPLRGPSHSCKRCNQRPQRHGSVVSVQAARPVHGAVLLINGRPAVRTRSPAPRSEARPADARAAAHGSHSTQRTLQMFSFFSLRKYPADRRQQGEPK